MRASHLVLFKRTQMIFCYIIGNKAQEGLREIFFFYPPVKIKDMIKVVVFCCVQVVKNGVDSKGNRNVYQKRETFNV